MQLNEERISTNLESDPEFALPVSGESPITNSNPSDTYLGCSRCLPLDTGVDFLAWTFSTLRQTVHESDHPLRSTRSERMEAKNAIELLSQYRDLQVGVVHYFNSQSRSTENHLVVIKSLIHGWGLFANSVFKPGQMVIEFAGEVISQSMANERELM